MTTKIPSIVKTNSADLPNSGKVDFSNNETLLVSRPGEQGWQVLNGRTGESAKLEAPCDALLKNAFETGLRPNIIDGKNQYREVVDGRFIKQFKYNTFFTDGFDEKISPVKADIEKTLLDYFDGKVSLENVEKMFQSVAVRMKDILYNRCITSGQNPADNKRIIEDTLFEFRRMSTAFANNACMREGEEKYSGNAGQTAYYNSDYYYACEDVLTATEKAAVELGAQWKSDPIDLEAWFEEGSGLNELYASFNSSWNYTNGLNRSLANIDESMVPPRDFEVCFIRTQAEADTVEIKWNGQTEKASVTFNERYGQNRYRLSDLFSSLYSKEGKASPLGHFMKSFTVYSYFGYIKEFDTAPWFNTRA